MKTFALQPKSMCWLIAAVFAAGCVSDPMSDPETSELSAAISATAQISDLRAVDGCAYRIRIKNQDYAPDDASRPEIAALFPPIGGRRTVQVDYVLTGGTNFLECAWGGKEELPEISVKLE